MRHARAAPLEHRVGAHGGAVDEAPHVARSRCRGPRGRRAPRPPRVRGRDGTLVTTTRPVLSSTAVRSVNVPPTSMPTMNMAQSPAASSTSWAARTRHGARSAMCAIAESVDSPRTQRRWSCDHDHHRLPEREGLPPAHRARIGAGPRDVARGDLRAGRQAHVGEPRPRAALGRLGVRGIGPVVEQGAEVHERIAERRHVPVEDGGHAVGVLRGELAVVELEIVVDDGRAARRRAPRGQARVDPLHVVRRVVRAGERPALGPAVELAVDEALGAAEVGRARTPRARGRGDRPSPRRGRRRARRPASGCARRAGGMVSRTTSPRRRSITKKSAPSTAGSSQKR